jgi:hypothetical protein
MNRRELKGKEKTLGEDHPDTLTSAGKLVRVLWFQGRYREAGEIKWRVLKRCKKALGKKHPYTLSVSRFAVLLQEQHRYKNALAQYERAYMGYTRVYGKEHPTTKGCWKRYTSLVTAMFISSISSK